MKDRNIRDSYRFYYKRVTDKIDQLVSERDMVVSERIAVTKVFRGIAERCELKWDFYEKFLARDDSPSPTIDDIIPIYNSSARGDINNKLSNISFDFNDKVLSMSQIKTYIGQILHLYIRAKELEDEIHIANCNKIPYYLYYFIIEQYYWSVAVSLLMGGYYHIKNIGMIKVVVKKTNFKKKKVNWGESLALLKEFAKDNHPDIYKEYKDNIISKVEFIDKMKPYVYNERTNPRGFKWLVRITNEFSPWLSYSKANCNINSKYRFSVTPTNFCNTKDRSQSAFVKASRKVEDIIYSKKLGFRDKINALLAFDPNYKDNFKLIDNHA